MKKFIALLLVGAVALCAMPTNAHAFGGKSGKGGKHHKHHHKHHHHKK